MASVTAKAGVRIRVTADPAFLHVAPVDLTSIFTGYGPLPAVIETRDQSGNWDGPGQTRTVVLADKSTARETLTLYERPRNFGYTVSEFSGSLGLLAEKAEGWWDFQEIGESGTTDIEWHYTFYSRSWSAYPLLWFIARIFWQGYMRKALDIMKQQIEGGAT